MLVNLINGVSAWIERMLGRSLGKQTYTQRYLATGEQELVLLQWPIVSVEYVKDLQRGTFVDPVLYDHDTTGLIGTLWRDEGFPLHGFRGGLAYDIFAYKRALEVQYTAGYVLPQNGTEDDPTTLPYDIQMIVWGAVMQEFSLIQSGAAGLKAFSISDVSWKFDKEPRQEWLTTLRLYMRL